MRLCLLLLGLALLCLFSPAVRAEEATPRSVLVLEESDAVRGRFYADMYAALRRRILSSWPPTSIYIENLDLIFFSGEEYERRLHALLLEKYRDRPIGVVVAVGVGALDRAIAWRNDLWPDAKIVFSVVSSDEVEGHPLPPDITGKTIRLKLEDMVATAKAVAPKLRQVVVLGEPFETHAASPFKEFATELPDIAKQFDVVDLTGMPMAQLRPRVANLPPDAVILYTPIYSDGAGSYFPAAEGLAMVASVANRPIVTPVETYIGLGAIGGQVLMPAIIGEEVADLTLALLGGADPSAIPITASASLKPVFDWNAMQRWGVQPAALPPGSDIRNRPLPVWQQYPVQSAIVAALVLLQSGFIAALMREARRRRQAEAEARARMGELAHFNRHATVGELSSSIAHELNQPLGAALAHAEAAQIVAETSPGDTKAIGEILQDIKRETIRASEIIARLRRLLKRRHSDVGEVNLNDVVDEAVSLTLGQAASGGIELSKVLTADPLQVNGDAIQLQQVVINLIVNAMDAIGDGGSLGRIALRTTRLDDKSAEISISDNGPGIPTERLKSIFEPLFTTKDHGMGLGLSIARTIVEAHDGKLSAENGVGGGAVFRIWLPLA